MKKQLGLITTRREEIMDACVLLYDSINFNEITLKEISAKTTFTRTSIYNYFNTKEEIFLAILQREYDNWSNELIAIIDSNSFLSKENLADELAETLSNKQMMLRIISMNLYDLETNSRMDRLIEFKKSYSNLVDSVKKVVRKFCNNYTEEDVNSFIYSFFPFIYGIYPYTNFTKKQIQASSEINLKYVKYSIHDLVFNNLMKIIK